MKCFIEESKFKICLFIFFLVHSFAFSDVSFCERDVARLVAVFHSSGVVAIKQQEAKKQGYGEGERGIEFKGRTSPESSSSQEMTFFDETTPIDISPSPDVDALGRENVDAQQPYSNTYNSRESSDEFRLETTSQELSYASHIFRLILSLAFVVGLAYIAIRLMWRGRLFSTNDDPYIKLVANLNIEQGKTLKVVTIGEKGYLIGVAGNNITKIAELDDQVLIDAMKLKAEGDAEYDSSPFTKIFSNFFPNKSKGDKGQISGSSNRESFKKSFSESLNDSLFKSQQERLKNINFQDDDKGEMNRR